jgi:hypothetical protein
MDNFYQKQLENTINELMRKIITLEQFNKSLLNKIIILKNKINDQQHNHNNTNHIQLKSKL